jgi:uncharacterized protein YcbX
MSLTLASIHIYPIKSLGGFSVVEARLGDRGLEHDRRWMLVDRDGRFLTQREALAMVFLQCAPHNDGFRITDIRDGGTLDLPWTIKNGEPHKAQVWRDTVELLSAKDEVNTWLSGRLGIACRLMHMPDAALRPTNPLFASGINSLSDGYPYMILSQASLDDLNTRLDAPLPMDRFRPNLVIAGGAAFQEDRWKEVAIGSSRFRLVKPCARCVITTFDQRTGERGKEPLRTLATYRSKDGNVLFGMNAMGEGASVRVGDAVIT